MFLCELSRELHVSRRTIENALAAAAGKKFRELREEALIAKVQSILVVTPALEIKELADRAGYRSPQAFARAVRRVCGVSPKELRARIAKQQAICETLS